jgi:hypothetical protein
MIKNKIVVLSLLCLICSFCFAQPQGGSSSSTDYTKELQSQVTNGKSEAEGSIREAADRAAAFSRITKLMNQRISDPVQYATIAKEIGVGGSDIMNLVERHAAMLSEPTFMQAMLESYPLARYPATLSGNSTQCQSEFWPNNFWCGKCLASFKLPFGISFCFLYGLAPANDSRFGTQMTTISRDNASAPLESSLTHQTLSVLDDLNIPSLAGVGSVVGTAQALGLINVNQVIDTIELKRICVDAMISKHALGAAAGFVRAGGAGAGRVVQDTIDNIGACIMKAAINPAFNLTKSKLDTAVRQNKITAYQRKILEASIKRDVVGRVGGTRTYQSTHTPAPLARYLQKSLKDVTYPSFRVLIAFPSLSVTIVPVNDPLINHNIKEPFREPGIPNFSEAFATSKAPQDVIADASLVDKRVQLAALIGDSVSDVSLSPHVDNSIGAPVPSVPNLRKNGQFDILNHIIGSSTGIPTMKLPMNQRMLKNQIMYFLQKNYAGNADLFIKQFKNPDFCSNPTLAYAFQKAAPFNFINGNNFLASLDKLSMLFSLLKLDTSATEPVSAIISKMKRAYGDNSFLTDLIRREMCTKETRTARNKPIMQAEGGQEMAVVGKLFARDIDDIATKHVRKIPMKSPVKFDWGLPSGLPFDVSQLSTVITQLQKTIEQISNITSTMSQANQLSGLAGISLPGVNDLQDATNGLAGAGNSIFGRGNQWTLPQVQTNPYFYANRYDGIPFVDKVQTSHSGLRQLVASAGGAPLSLSNKCRAEDISDQNAKDEKLVFPGQEATIYSHFTAFLTCPAYSAIDKSTKVNGLPLGAIMDLVLNTIPLPGGKRGLTKFTERYGQD